MRKILLAAIAAGAALTAVAPADAAQGCGPGAHRGPRGYCHSNYRPGFVAPGIQIGVLYPGRGYWGGGGYWRDRYAWHGGWRYR